MADQPDITRMVTSWLSEPDRTLPRGNHAPGPSRLAKHCLAPLVAEFVCLTPTETLEPRIHTLLDAAEPSLTVDLAEAIIEVDDILARITEQLPEIGARSLLTTDAIQNRVAKQLRELLRVEWARATDDGGAPVDSIRPVWTGPQDQLAVALTHTAWLRRCRAWAAQVHATDAVDFARAWRGRIQAAIADADPDVLARSVEVGLGDLPVPQVVIEPEQPYEWRLATDRSFHNRLKLYWHDAHVPRTLDGADPHATPPEDRFESRRTPGEDLVAESIQRTLSPYGLRFPAHHLIVEIVGVAIGQAAAEPIRKGGGLPLLDVWGTLLADPDPAPHRASLIASLAAHATTKLRRMELRAGDVDEHVVSRCVARRLWVRLHAWELVESRIPPRELRKALNIAIDQTVRNAAGVRRADGRQVGVDTGRTDNTLPVLQRISAEMPDARPDQIVAEYERRYQILKDDPDRDPARQLRSPTWVRLLYESVGDTNG